MIKGYINNYLILLIFYIAQTLSNLVSKPNHCGLTGLVNIVINRSVHNIVEYKFKCLYPRVKLETDLIILCLP